MSQQGREEGKPRIVRDSADRNSMHEQLQSCIHSLTEDQHTERLVNIVTGAVVVNPSVDVDNTYEFELTEMNRHGQRVSYIKL